MAGATGPARRYCFGVHSFGWLIVHGGARFWCTYGLRTLIRGYTPSPYPSPSHTPTPFLNTQAVQEYLVDIREHDVPHHMRFCIDTDVRCGCWYTVRSQVSKG